MGKMTKNERRLRARFVDFDDYLPSSYTVPLYRTSNARAIKGRTVRRSRIKLNQPGGTYTVKLRNKGRLQRWIQSRKRKPGKNAVNVMGVLSQIAKDMRTATEPRSE